MKDSGIEVSETEKEGQANQNTVKHPKTSQSKHSEETPSKKKKQVEERVSKNCHIFLIFLLYIGCVLPIWC